MSKEFPLTSIEMLIEHYETQMKRSANRSAALVPMLSYLSVYETINEGFRESLNRDAFKIPKEKVKEEVAAEEKSNDKNTCEEASYFEFSDGKAEFLGVDERNFEVFLKQMDDEKKNNFNDCWGCDLRPVFDWQIKPVNFLNEIEQALSDIENSIDSFMEQISPRSFLREFCPIFDMFDSDFRWMCGADLMALMNAVQMVLARYMNQALSFQVNWTTLLGPLIKFIAESLTESMELIRDILLAPLDCIKSVFITIDNVIDEFQEMTSMAETVFEGVAKPFTPAKIDEKEYKKWRKNASADPGPVVEKRKEAKIKEDIVGALTKNRLEVKQSKDSKIPTGFSFNLNSDLDSIFQAKKAEKDANQILPVANPYGEENEEGKKEKIDLIKMLILTINTAEKFINEFFANLIFSVKSLNQMIIGNISFNLKLGGTILFLLDLIEVIRTWIELAAEYGIDGFSKLCEKFNESENKEEFQNEYFDRWINFGGPDDPVINADKNTCET